MIAKFFSLFKGFVAAAVAVLTVHQSIVLLLDASGLIIRQAWSLEPMGPWSVPTIVNATFWGGLWGILLAALYERLPGRTAWMKGLAFGWFIFVFANNLILPLIKGQPLFYGFDQRQLLAVFLILSGFGAAAAMIYDLMRTRT